MHELPQNNSEELVGPAAADPLGSLNDGAEQTGLEREDDRWLAKRRGWRDWWVLFLMIVTYLVWAGLVYFLEPGIR